MTFLLLAGCITLFPPFHWGTEADRRHWSGKPGGRYQDFKSREILFGQSRRQFLVDWGWDYKAAESVPLFVPLDREISFEDLALEYILAGILAGIALLSVSALKTRRLPDRPNRPPAAGQPG
jgi:hypothetical protein